MSLKSFQDRIGYTFKNTAYLEAALTHRSYAFEHPSCKENNQRLEFLGDAILDFVIGEELYRTYPREQEGFLSRERSRLVCEGALCQLARRLDFDSALRMGKGEVSSAGMLRDGTLADAYEAVIGAIYLDGGLDAARSFILTHHRVYLDNLDGDWLAADAKTRLQEKAQALHRTIRYSVISQVGPSHAPVFEVAAWLNEQQIGTGCGRSKKEAEQAAAQYALEHWDDL